MFTILTQYYTAHNDTLTIKRETTDNINNAIGAFSIYAMDPECIGCVIMTGAQIVLQYDRP